MLVTRWITAEHSSENVDAVESKVTNRKTWK